MNLWSATALTIGLINFSMNKHIIFRTSIARQENNDILIWAKVSIYTLQLQYIFSFQ